VAFQRPAAVQFRSARGMTESFPSTLRASTGVRLCAVAIGLLGIVVATRTTLTSAAWVGRTFPGFLVLPSRIVPSIGLANWSGSTVADVYQSQVIAVEGRPVASPDEVYEAVATTAPGTIVRYELAKNGVHREVPIASQRFEVWDWVLLFGAYLLNSIVYLTCGLIVWVLRPYSALARAFLAFGVAWSAFFLTAMDLYGPATFERVHYVADPLASAAALQMVMLFPQPHRLARWRFVGYVPALAIALGYQLYIHDQSTFSTILMIDMLLLGMIGVFLGLRLASEYWYGTSQLARQRVRVMALGTIFGFGFPGAVLVISAVVWGQVSMNLAAFTPFLFALSIAYAIVKHDLLEIDAMVKRGAYYLLLTGAVGVAYMGAVYVFNSVLQENAFTRSSAFPVLFTLVVLLVFNPLRSRLQAFVDRVFFRTQYDGAQVLATLGGQLGAALSRDRIATIVCDSVQGAIPNAATHLFLGGADGGLRAVDSGAEMPAMLARRLAQDRVVTAFDSPEVYGDETEHEAIRGALAGLDAEIVVPMQVGTDLPGALSAGPKRSGLFYTAGDAGFLRAVAHQAAIALANAQSYEALIALNASLEERVRERTAQLEAAYEELKAAETHLVQSEKMASLGRLVAGVAHEINNPVSFISTSVAPLRRRLERAATASPADAARLLAEAREIIDIMARGAERTTAIVRDLRSFSRLGEAARKSVDLQEGLEVTLRLLESRWRDRLTIHRDYGMLPAVECDPGQLNQVFMNILANACDAAPAGGNIWLTTRADGTDVSITVRDDGPGIPPDRIGRIFDPFFTTKDVGSGTGLGLAIAHGIVAAHGGRIEVESAPGAGATFRVVLPAGTVSASLDRAAVGR
jgi:signal transduction histidine kinase